MKYKNKFGKINLLGDVNFFNNKTLALSMSGGADSTLLCYLLANTISQKNLQIIIQPYNGYNIWAPTDSASVPNIIKFIRKKFPTVDIQWPISVVFNTYGIEDKNSYIVPLSDKLKSSKIVDEILSGITMGPPLEIQKTQFNKDKITRLPGYYLWNEVENPPDHLAPFKNIDKRFIMQCYKDLGIEDLLSMTNSCVSPQGNCLQCWWCRERAWAFNEVFAMSK